MLKSGESKYEINTNLPLARVCRLKSDVHDFSPSFLPFVGSSWRTGRGRTLDLPPYLLFLLLSFRCGGSLFWLGFWCTLECLPFTVLLDHEALLFLLLEPEKTYPPFRHENGFLPFRHRSLPWQTLEKVTQIRGRLRGLPPYPLPQSRQGRRSLVLVRKRVRLSLRDTEWLNLQAVRAWLLGKEQDIQVLRISPWALYLRLPLDRKGIARSV